MGRACRFLNFKGNYKPKILGLEDDGLQDVGIMGCLGCVILLQ